MYTSSASVSTQSNPEYTTNNACLQNTTKLRMTADLDSVAFPPESGQAEQLSSNLENSVGESGVCQETSTKLHYVKHVASPEGKSRTRYVAINGSHLNTEHSIEAVSRSLDKLMASGKAMIEDLVNSRPKVGLCSGQPEDRDSLLTLRKRSTSDLGKVANVSDEDMGQGGSLVDTLNYVSQEMDGKSQNSVSTSRIQRNTYDLSELGDVLDNSKESLEELLKDLGCNDYDECNILLPETINKRQTYDLNDISSELDESISTGQSFEETLEQISLNENISKQTSVQDKRRTYDLSDVSSELDQSINTSSPVADLCAVNVQLEESVAEKRRTYNLNDVSNELDHSVNSGESIEDTLELISSTEMDQPLEMKRRTYDLSNVVVSLPSSQEDLLHEPQNNNNFVQSGKNNNTSLDKLLSEIPADSQNNGHALKNSKNINENVINSHNSDKTNETFKETQQNSDNTKYQNIDKPFTKNVISETVTNSQKSNLSSSTSQNINKTSANSPKVDATSSNSQNSDGKRNTYNVENSELTPSQWTRQMKKAEASPVVSMVTSKDSKPSGKLKRQQKNQSPRAKQVNKTKPPRRNSPQLKKNLASTFDTSKRSKSVSTASKSHATSKSNLEIRSRSMSDSRTEKNLKSKSGPDVLSGHGSSPNSSLDKKSILDRLKEMSPGVRNYLTNKLGLSDEQCIEVHRRLSSDTLETPEQYKMENRRTYSLDDVAHSLDIATSQGLPMTKVLDELEFDHNLDKDVEDGKVVDKKETEEVEAEQHKENDFVKEPGTKLDSREDDSTRESHESTSIKYVTLRPNIKSKFTVNRKTYTVTSGNKCESSNNEENDTSLENMGQFKLKTKKNVYKPSTKLHSFSHLLGGQNVKRRNGRGVDETKRNTYTLESVAESLEKAQDAGETMINALKRLSGSLESEEPDVPVSEKRKTYSLEDVSDSIETGTASGVPIVDTLRKIAEPDIVPDANDTSENDKPVQKAKRKAPPKPKRTFAKPEIKFESDSFVIEYFTSSKKNQSNYCEVQSSDTDEKRSVSGVNSEESVDGSSELQPPNEVLSTVVELPSCKQSEKVVLDLDSLLAELAAERDKTKGSAVSNENTVGSIGESMPVKERPAECSENVANSEINADKQSSSAGLPVSDVVSEMTSVEPVIIKIPVQEIVESTVSMTNVEFGEQINELELNLISEVDEPKVSNCLDYDTTQPDKIQHESSEVCATVSKPDLLSGTSTEDVCDFENSDDVNHLEKTEDENGKELKISSKPDLLQQVVTDNADVSKDVMFIDNCTESFGEEFSGVGTVISENKETCSSSIEPVGACLLPKPPEESDKNTLNNNTEEQSKTMVIKKSCDKVDNTLPDIEYMYIHLPGNNEVTEHDGELVVHDGLPSDTNEETGSASKSEGVSRELNLLRLKLAEKQRDIVAQKQRTKEQLEEERKRLGQNVFWFAVGKGKDKKESSELRKDEKNIEVPLPDISKKPMDPSQVEKTDTLTKQSPDQELPPSMEKLHDVSYNMKTISSNLRSSHGDLVSRKSEQNDESDLPTLSSTTRRSSEEVVHEFRLSRRQTHGSHESLLNRVQISPKSENLGSLGDLAKPRAPVMNYKSRITVPLTYTSKQSPESSGDMTRLGNLNTRSFGSGEIPVYNNQVDVLDTESCLTKPSSLDFSDMDIPGDIIVSPDERPGVSETNEPSSPIRKRWNTDPGDHGEPQIAISKSNYDILNGNSRHDISEIRQGNYENVHGMSKNGHGISENRYETFENRQGISDDNARWVNQTPSRGNASPGLITDTSDEILSGVNSENHVIVDELDSGISRNSEETPKKGLSLFIGESTVGENGLTPEQLKKKERFLKNRQQKKEEERLKKEATLEKKKRKEEKMSAIQFRREQEELGRQTRLQEKKEQAELAKMERQRYELQRKENLSRNNFVVDGGQSGYQGHPRTVVNHHATTARVPHEGGLYGMTSPAASPSAFSGFTGVQSYVKPSGKTNRKLIINAISHVCLPGAVNKDTKDKCLQAMTESSAQHFLILFREGLKFRGLYSLDLENNQVLKVHGVGPRSVTEKMIQQLYKYNSGAKEFSKISAKSFSLSVDGFTLQKSCWQSASSKTSIASKTLSNYKSSTYRTGR